MKSVGSNILIEGLEILAKSINGTEIYSIFIQVQEANKMFSCKIVIDLC